MRFYLLSRDIALLKEVASYNNLDDAVITIKKWIPCLLHVGITEDSDGSVANLPWQIPVILQVLKKEDAWKVFAVRFS